MTVAAGPMELTTERRKPDFTELADVAADVEHLRRAGHDRLGNWSLPQIAAHLAHVIEHALTPPPSTEPTPEQAARRDRFFGIVFSPEGMPPGLPLPAESQPAAGLGDEQFARLTAALAKLADYPHTHVLAGGAGPIEIKDARRLHIAHAAHHLSFLIPRPTRRLNLKFATERGVIADVGRLQTGYRAVGTWTLPQTCWHLAAPLRIPLIAAEPPAAAVLSSPEYEATLKSLARYDADVTPLGMSAPPGTVPPADCGASAIDECVRLLQALEQFSGDFIAFGQYGVVPTARFRSFVLAHAAHHLSLLVPAVGKREGLVYVHEDDVADDVHRLRRGYIQTGGWTLGQICWHLAATTNARMVPGPHPANSPEQDARAGLLKFVFSSGKLPLGIVAPDRLLPPLDAGDESINACLDALEDIKRYSDPFAPHRLFGQLTEAETRRHNLIHCAHHLSNLVPTTPAPLPRGS